MKAWRAVVMRSGGVSVPRQDSRHSASADDDDQSSRQDFASGLSTESDRLAADPSAAGLAAAAEQQRSLTFSRLLRKYTPEFVNRFPQQAVPQVQSTLAKLELCRTAAIPIRMSGAEFVRRSLTGTDREGIYALLLAGF